MFPKEQSKGEKVNQGGGTAIRAMQDGGKVAWEG